jgi:copper chaperone CopZ
MILSKSVANWPQLGVQFLMAFLPELVHMWNTSPFQLSSFSSRGVVNIVEATGQAMVEAELIIPGMGCVACISKINSTLQQVAGVKGSQAWLENNSGGKAKVQYTADSHDGIDEIATKLVDAVRGAGFDTCSIARIQQVTPLVGSSPSIVYRP